MEAIVRLNPMRRKNPSEKFLSNETGNVVVGDNEHQSYEEYKTYNGDRHREPLRHWPTDNALDRDNKESPAVESGDREQVDEC